MACAEGAARSEQQQEQQRKRRNLARAILTCFCARASCSSRTQDLRSESRDEDDVAEEGMRVGGRRFSSSKNGVVVDKPLRKIAEAFEELANVVKSESESVDVVEVAAFSTACSYVGTLFGCIGFHFKFIEMDYLTKVNDLADASKSFLTLESMVDKDMQTNTVRNQGSHSRNLLMIKRGLDFLRALFQQILLTEGNSIREAVQKAYTEIFQSHHGWALRKAVASRLHFLPTKQQLCRKLNEDESAVTVLMQAYVMASLPLLQYIDNIFLSRQLGIDW